MKGEGGRKVKSGVRSASGWRGKGGGGHSAICTGVRSATRRTPRQPRSDQAETMASMCRLDQQTHLTTNTYINSVGTSHLRLQQQPEGGEQAAPLLKVHARTRSSRHLSSLEESREAGAGGSTTPRAANSCQTGGTLMTAIPRLPALILANRRRHGC